MWGWGVILGLAPWAGALADDRAFPPQAVVSPWWLYDLVAADPDEIRAGADRRQARRANRAQLDATATPAERFDALDTLGDVLTREARRAPGEPEAFAKALAVWDEAILLGSRELADSHEDRVASLRLRRGLVGWAAQDLSGAEIDLSMLLAGRMRPESALALPALAEIAWERGDPAQAQVLAELVWETGGPLAGLGGYRLAGLAEAEGDLPEAGRWLVEAHQSLRRSPWLQAPVIANHAREHDAVRIARATGAGGDALIWAICAESGAGCAPRLLKRLPEG